MEALIKKIKQEIEPVYLSSSTYTHTIWRHVVCVALFAKEFAAKLGADQFVAEAAGLLHDIGAAKFGKEDHHVSGAKEAALILLKCACPLEFIGPILSAIYTHRGSQRISFQTPEAKCVAAADAKEHFVNLEELWLVQTRDLGIPEIEVYQTVSGKLERDWEKIEPEIKILLGETYKTARRELLEIASKYGYSKKRKK